MSNQPKFDFNTKEFLIYAWRYNNEQLGRLIHQLAEACLARNEDELRKYPFVGRVYKGTAKRAHIPTDVRRKVLSAGKCVYCNSTEELQIDHIKPYSKGGTHDIENLQCLCRRCNRIKSDKEPT